MERKHLQRRLVDACENSARRANRLAQSLWRGALSGFGGERTPRYVVVGAVGAIAIWTLATAYLVLTPRTFVGEFTLILPGAGAGSSINLNSIGQASSLSESAFSNTRVSPTESYKRLLMSDRVIDAAKANAETDWFPRPRIKLLDQTQFMEISVAAKSPDNARIYAESLMDAFLQEIDSLRAEERRQREAGYTQTLAEFEKNVTNARDALLTHQMASGLSTVDQYNARIAMVDSLQSELNRSRIEEAEARERLKALLGIMAVSENEAATALAYAADPVFLKLSQNYADVEASLAEISYKFGDNHPRKIALDRERAGVRTEIIARGRQFTNASEAVTLAAARKLAGAEYSSLLKEIVAADAHHRMLAQRSVSLMETLERDRVAVRALSDDAAKLEDLNRSLQVAEAVFRSAIARIDTTKSDLFASYPLVQTIEEPTLPAKPSSPIPALAIIGAGAATILYLMGLILLCLRLPLLNALLKKS